MTSLLGLARRALTAVYESPRREGAPIDALWNRLTKGLGPREAASLPEAIAAIVPTVEVDGARLQILVDTLVTYDIFEAAQAVVDVAGRTLNPHLILAASQLVAHPGVAQEHVRTLEIIADTAALSPVEERAIRTYLAPDRTSKSRLESMAWPGLAADAGPSVPPVVAVDSDQNHADAQLAILAWLVKWGALVRRIPRPFARPPHREWLSSDTPIVSWGGDVTRHLRENGLAVHAGQVVVVDRIDPRDLGNLHHAIGQHLPSGRVLRPWTIPAGVEIVENPFDEHLLKLGAHDIHDMAFLSGGATSTIYRIAKEGLSRPREVRGVNYWRFGDLVGLRTWTYFRSATGKRVNRAVIPAIAELSGSPMKTSIGVSADGRVFKDTDGVWTDIATGQETIDEVLRLDKVFQPFHVGAGAVPDLLTPSEFTITNPEVQGGSPVVRGHRISARSLAQLVRARGTDALEQQYSSVPGHELRDAAQVGERILST